MTLIDKAEALAEIKKLFTVGSVIGGDLTLKKVEAAFNALPARHLHDPKGYLRETAHLYDCEISPSRECTCGLSDLRALATISDIDSVDLENSNE